MPLTYRSLLITNLDAVNVDGELNALLVRSRRLHGRLRVTHRVRAHRVA